MLETTLRWESITPLARPVVPDEYGSKHKSRDGFTERSGSLPAGELAMASN